MDKQIFTLVKTEIINRYGTKSYQNNKSKVKIQHCTRPKLTFVLGESAKNYQASNKYSIKNMPNLTKTTILHTNNITEHITKA